MKTYYQQKYPHTQKVVIIYKDLQFEDEIKGLNRGHALYLAKLNWPEAIICEA